MKTEERDHIYPAHTRLSHNELLDRIAQVLVLNIQSIQPVGLQGKLLAAAFCCRYAVLAEKPSYGHFGIHAISSIFGEAILHDTTNPDLLNSLTGIGWMIMFLQRKQFFDMENTKEMVSFIDRSMHHEIERISRGDSNNIKEELNILLSSLIYIMEHYKSVSENNQVELLMRDEFLLLIINKVMDILNEHKELPEISHYQSPFLSLLHQVKNHLPAADHFASLTIEFLHTIPAPPFPDTNMLIDDADIYEQEWNCTYALLQRKIKADSTEMTVLRNKLVLNACQTLESTLLLNNNSRRKSVSTQLIQLAESGHLLLDITMPAHQQLPGYYWDAKAIHLFTENPFIS
ncbi:hypothetical protein [Chitinophaga flava]|uniref:Uncharacterized protein n=1 Tax=Chitinophaga flava TaxID=2259036 RepID=A0A365XSV1_9BACT|nr:hypothetical protein [Chitinophaga flava]RBL89456.1 hypothetical protein DF182_23360 [Chitinophaga flava]